MAIEKLLEQIRRQTDERIAAIKETAEKEARQIIQTAEEKLNRQRQQEINRIDQEIKEYEESILSPIRLKARQIILETKQRLTEEVLDKILVIWEKQPVRFKQKLYRRWLKNYSGGELIIAAAEKNVWTDEFLKAINQSGKKFRLAAADNQLSFGFRLKEEKWEADFTDRTLRENFRQPARIWLNQVWFNG